MLHAAEGAEAAVAEGGDEEEYGQGVVAGMDSDGYEKTVLRETLGYDLYE